MDGNSRIILFFILFFSVAYFPSTTKATTPADAVISLSKDASVLILGERHRQPEGHDLFFEMISAVLKRGERVLVGLEIPFQLQSELEKAFSGEISFSNIANHVIESPSYIQMLEKLKALNTDSQRLKIIAMDSLSGDRDLKMAERIEAEMTENSWDRALILVGNLHALKNIPWSENIASGMMNLAEILNKRTNVLSVVQIYSHACLGPRRPYFYPIEQKKAAVGILNIWQGLNTVQLNLKMPAEMNAADAVMEWSCETSSSMEAVANNEQHTLVIPE